MFWGTKQPEAWLKWGLKNILLDHLHFIVFGIPAASARNVINGWVVNEHNRSWINVQGCRWSRLMLPNISRKLTEFLLSCNRKDCRLLVGILTGHNACARHLYVIGVSETQICSSCEESEDSTEHFLCYCPAFSRIRRQLFGEDVIGAEFVGSLSVKSILHFIKETEKFTE